MQLPIDTAALLPSNAPIPGMAIPASGEMPADVLRQSALFADALRLILGENGQPVAPLPISELITMLPNGTIPTKDAVHWLTEGNVETDGEPSAMVLSDDSGQQETDDPSQFHFLTAVNAESKDAPILTIALGDDPEAEVLPEPLRPAVNRLAKDQNQSVPKVVAGTLTDIEAPANSTTATATTVHSQAAELALHNGQAPQPLVMETEPPTLASLHQATKSNSTSAKPAADTVNREPVAPRITVTTTAQQSVETLISPATSEREEPVLAQPRVSAPETAGGQTTVAAKSEAESFLRIVSQIDNDVALKVEITPAHNGKPVAAASNRMDQLTGSNESRPTIHPVLESGAAQGRTLAAKATQPSVQIIETQTVTANESPKVIPLVSVPVETIDPKPAKTRTPVQHTEVLESKPSSDGKLVSKTDLPNNGRATTPIITKPVAAQPSTQNTPHQDSHVLAGEPPVTSSDPAKAPARTTEDPQVQVSRPSANSVKVDQPQTQSAHTVSAVSPGQTTGQAERIDSPPPVRFQVEIPKPLRVPGQIRVHLDPPELGQVRIDLTSTRNGIVGTLRFQSEQARHIVEREIGQLQKTLQDAGVRVERLEVLATSSGDTRNSLHANMNNQQSWSQNPASQNAFGGTARGHAGAQNQNTHQNQPAQSETLVSHNAYPTMHIGHVNLVA